MRKTIIATALLALTATSFAIPASAAPLRTETAAATTLDITKIHSRNNWQNRPVRQRILTPRQVSRKLYRSGYRNIRRIVYSNGCYIVRANGRRGPLQITVNARTGSVISRAPLRRQYYPGYGHRGQRTGFSFSFSVR